MNQRLDEGDVLAAPREKPPETASSSKVQRTDVPCLPGIATQLIGERLRAMYASMTREPVPDALLDLIRQLEKKEGE